MEVTSDSWFTFPGQPAAVRAALAATDRYVEWWPWLVEFEADGLYAGARWRCAVRSPLRTMLRFRLLIDQADELIVVARLDGDLAGAARITLAPEGTGDTSLRLQAEVRPRSTPIVALARLMPPVAQWSHDRIVESGARQFADALTRQPQ